jgi:putative ABC transport system permease protein
MARKVAEYRAQQDGVPVAPPPSKPEPATTPATQEAHDDHDDHEGHHDHSYHLEDGKIVLEVPRQQWKINSILVRSRGGQPAMSIIWDFNQNPDAMAVSPATEMREFTRTFLRGSSLILLMLAILVSVVAAVSILVSIYNSIAARRREIAILRALGATRKRILSIICLEAGLIGLIGSVIGMLMGISIAAIASVALDRAMGQPLNWASLGWLELLYFIGAIALAVVAGLVPALKAYSTSVADNLVGE